MPTIASGQSVSVYVPLASSMTFTPASGGRMSINGRTADGSAITPREIYAATVIDVPAGSTLSIDAQGGEGSYSDPAFTPAQVAAIKPWVNWGALGDSITAQGYVVSGTTSYYGSDGYWVQMLVELGWPVESLTVAATGGHTTAQMLARIDTDLAGRGIQACFVMGGQNDGNADTTIANLSQIYAKLNSLGMAVIACTVLPSDQSDGIVALKNRINTWIRAQHNGTTIIVLDTATPITDPATGYPKTNMMRETVAGTRIHPSTQGAREIARPHIATLTPYVGKVPATRGHPLGGYATNPLLSGANSAGAGGFTASAGITASGTGPDAMDVYVRNTGVATLTRPSVDVGGRLVTPLRIAFTSTADADGVTVSGGGSYRSGVASSRYDQTWATALAVQPGQRRRPTVANGLMYVALNSGTTTTEPTWPTTEGATVTDAAGIKWIAARIPTNGDQFVGVAEVSVPSSVSITGNVAFRMGVIAFNRNNTQVGQVMSLYWDLSAAQGKGMLTLPGRDTIIQLVTPPLTLSGLSDSIGDLTALRYLCAEFGVYGNASSSCSVDLISLDIARVSA